MNKFVNIFNQPIGDLLPNWTPPHFINFTELKGNYCSLVKLDLNKHAQDLFNCLVQESSEKNWTYLPYGPFSDFDQFYDWLTSINQASDPYFFSIIDPLNKNAIGLAALMNINPKSGSIEVGHIHFSTRLQKSITATESMYLLMNKVFELGYRRYEWKCDCLNEPSRKAALRLGFKYEGNFRQATVYKGRNRDTDWFSIIDSEWPHLKRSFNLWLSPSNFDSNRQQIKSLKVILSPE